MVKLYDKKIFKKHAALFEALAEYDRTGKLLEIKDIKNRKRKIKVS